MAIYTDMNHVHQSRTLKPVYGRTQATPQSVQLDSAWDVTTADIFPGTVLTRLAGGKVTVCDGTKIPAGLSGNWLAPAFGIDEIRINSREDMAMYVLSPDAVFTVSKPAYDTTAPWADAKAALTSGKAVYLKSNTKGLLTVEMDGAGTAIATTPSVNSVVRLIDFDGSSVITIAGLR